MGLDTGLRSVLRATGVIYSFLKTNTPASTHFGVCINSGEAKRCIREYVNWIHYIPFIKFKYQDQKVNKHDDERTNSLVTTGNKRLI